MHAACGSARVAGQRIAVPQAWFWRGRRAWSPRLQLRRVVLWIGAVAVAVVAILFAPGLQGSGIPQTIAALQIADEAARSRLLSLRIAFGKLALTLIGLLSGASVGREGPTVQIGAMIMHSLGRPDAILAH
jgi:H+/Cl- antiporter ClcA